MRLGHTEREGFFRSRRNVTSSMSGWRSSAGKVFQNRGLDNIRAEKMLGFWKQFQVLVLFKGFMTYVEVLKFVLGFNGFLVNKEDWT